MKIQLGIVPLYVVLATFDEDGPSEVSPWFTSRRKVGKWMYSRAWLLKAKQNREYALGRITGMDEEMNLDEHVARVIRVTRADVRRGPRGWVAEISVAMQLEMLKECF